MRVCFRPKANLSRILESRIVHVQILPAVVIALDVIARGDGSYHKRLATFAKTELLILDDFGLKPLTQAERLDLLELIDDRHGRRSTLVTSQLPIAHWHAYLGEDPTVADALLDRLLSAAHRLELKGESLRKRQKQNGKELDAERAKQ